MGGRFEEGSSSTSAKRRRRDWDCDCDCAARSRPRRKKHLYLALDDWTAGYSIYKLDADDILDLNHPGRLELELPEPAAIRIYSPARTHMDFAALGTNIFAAPNPRYTCHSGDHAPPAPTIVYNTRTAALTVGRPLPPGVPVLGAAMAAGGKLYALTNQVLGLQALSWAPVDEWHNPCDEERDWIWSSVPSPPPCCGMDVVAYALHPDGCTIFMSTDSATHCLDTSNGSWKKLGDWVLPFSGQAYFDGYLDAWVGIHYKEEGYVCCCPVASRTAAASRPPGCRMLKERLFRHNNEAKWMAGGRYLKTTLTYMGNGGFCLVENILRRGNALDSVLHVTLFSLEYDRVGELRTESRPCTRSYAVSKNTMLFSHAAFWM